MTDFSQLMNIKSILHHLNKLISKLHHSGLSHLNKMWQPLNVNSRQLQTESKFSVFSSLLFCLFTHNNTALEKFNLTRRERQVAELLLRGKSADEISEELSISPNTAKVHVQRIYRKSNVTSRAEFLFIMNQYTV